MDLLLFFSPLALPLSGCSGYTCQTFLLQEFEEHMCLSIIRLPGVARGSVGVRGATGESGRCRGTPGLFLLFAPRTAAKKQDVLTMCQKPPWMPTNARARNEAGHPLTDVPAVSSPVSDSPPPSPAPHSCTCLPLSPIPIRICSPSVRSPLVLFVVK